MQPKFLCERLTRKVLAAWLGTKYARSTKSTKAVETSTPSITEYAETQVTSLPVRREVLYACEALETLSSTSQSLCFFKMILQASSSQTAPSTQYDIDCEYIAGMVKEKLSYVFGEETDCCFLRSLFFAASRTAAAKFLLRESKFLLLS